MPDFIVKGFNYRGGLLLETTHRGETSAAIEIDVWQTRMRKTGEAVAYAHLIDCRPGGTLTTIPVHAGTIIPWSWTKSKTDAGR
jgi:hypothetical protein